jgi:calcium/calmodulin-dependent protein kinase I
VQNRNEFEQNYEEGEFIGEVSGVTLGHVSVVSYSYLLFV